MSQKFASVSDTRSHPRLGLAPHTSHDAIGVRKRQRLEQHAVHDAPERGRRADAQREHADDRAGEERLLPQKPQRAEDVLLSHRWVSARAGAPAPIAPERRRRSQRLDTAKSSASPSPRGAQRRADGPRPAGRRRFHAEHEDLLHVGADLSTDRGRRREQHDAVQASEHGVRSMTCEGAGRVAARTAGSAAWRAPRPRRPPGAPPPPRTFAGRAA